MRTTMVRARDLHAGMYLVRNKGVRKVGKHICELLIDPNGVTVYTDDEHSTGRPRHRFGHNKRVEIVK